MNDKQKRFVAHYLKDLNATKAAIAAGYSPKAAKEIGSRLLTNANVAEAIVEGQARLAAKLEITAERVARELARIAFLDPRKFFNDNGTAKRISELDDDTAAALGGVEVFEEYQGSGEKRELIGYTKRFKLADKGASLERLGRHLGMFKDRIGVDGAFEITVRHIGPRNTTSGSA